MDVQETALPGIGLRHDFTTAGGRRVGVVSHRTGRRELLLYSADDPDACSEVVNLTDDEADALAELLGAARVVERIARLNEQVEGLVTEGVAVEPGSRYDGQRLADTQLRTRTGASIIAVTRRGEVLPMPRTDFLFQAGDVVLVVGTVEAVEAAAKLLTGG